MTTTSVSSPTQTLRFHPDAQHMFPASWEFIVDAAAGEGRGRGRGVWWGGRGFESVRTGRSWEERFVWRMGGFDDEEGRIGRWEIWADALSAWEGV